MKLNTKFRGVTVDPFTGKLHTARFELRGDHICGDMEVTYSSELIELDTDMIAPIVIPQLDSQLEGEEAEVVDSDTLAYLQDSLTEANNTILELSAKLKKSYSEIDDLKAQHEVEKIDAHKIDEHKVGKHKK